MNTPTLHSLIYPATASPCLVAVLLMASLGTTARAATFYNVDCYCDPKTEGRVLPAFPENVDIFFVAKTGCICSESYTLPKAGTKEFRFRCKSEDAHYLPAVIGVYDRDKPTTCTTFTRAFDYGTMSCTNWSALSTDVVKLQAICTTLEEAYAAGEKP